MNFYYNIKNGQLYLAQSHEEAEFEFLGLGFRKSLSSHLLPLASLLKDLEESISILLLSVEASRYPNSEYYSELQKINSDFVFKPEKELIFFGGSFNPWHQGHKACLELLGTKKCIILPDRNPFKEVTKIIASQAYQDIYQHLDQKYQYLNPEFILKEDKNPTYTWIEATRQRLPHVNLGLLMGMDSLKSIQTWFRADDLLNRLDRIYVASRQEDDSEHEEIKKKLIKYTQLEVIILGRHPFESLSSTALRKIQIKKGP